MVSDSLWLVNSVHNLPNWQVIFWENSNNITEELQSILLINFFLRLVEMTFRLVHARYSLPEWHPVWDWVGMWNHMFFCWCRQMYRLISVAFLVSCGRVSDNSWLSLAESATTVFRSVNLRSLLCLSITDSSPIYHRHLVDITADTRPWSTVV